MVFCCIAMVGIATLYFILLWLRQVFSWPRRDVNASLLPSPPRGMTGHGALPVYGHTYLFTSRAGDTALLFTTSEEERLQREYSCFPANCCSCSFNRPLGDCFCLFIWGQWRVAVIGPHRAQIVLQSTPLEESWPWTPPINLLGKSCFAFLKDEKEREHLRMLIARPLCHAQILLYAPIFAQLAEQCLRQIQNGKFGKKKNSTSSQQQQQQDDELDMGNSSQHGGGSDFEDDGTFVNGPSGEVYYKVKWEALRSYTLDLIDGPILNTQKWNDEIKNVFLTPPPPPLKQESGESTTQQSSSSSSPTIPIIVPQTLPYPTRETMLLYMERMKRGIDVIKTTFGPEWMYIWLVNEYGRALNARQDIDKLMRKHVALLAEAEQKVRHAVGHAYTDPTTQPIPLLTLRENLLRNKEGIMGIDYSSSSGVNHASNGNKRIIKPQFSARPRAQSAPDYVSMALEESPSMAYAAAQLGHAAHEADRYSHEAAAENDNNLYPLRLYHSSDDAAFYTKLRHQQQQHQLEKDKRKKSVRLLAVMDEMKSLCNNDCNNNENDTNNDNNIINNKKATATTNDTAIKTTAAAATVSIVDDYVEPYTTEQDLARPRYETSPIRPSSLRKKMQQQLAELESHESITTRQFHDEMDRPRILRNGEQQQQQQVANHTQVIRNDENNKNNHHFNGNATAAAAPALPPAPPRPVMSVLERFMKQHDNAGNGLSQIVMAEISVLLWMMMDVGNAWTAMALHLLSADREACHLVQDELDALVLDFASGDGGQSSVAASTPLHLSLLFTPSVMSRMKYLDALLYEAIRLCPENLGGMKKTTKTVELPDAGVQIPKDTNIFFCQPTDMVFDIHKALGKKPENLGRQYPSVELYGFLPLHGLEVPLMVLQSKVFLITLLQKFSPFISPKRTFLRRITTKLNQSINNIKHKTHQQHRRTASGDCCTDALAAATRRNKSFSSDEEEPAVGHDHDANDSRNNINIGDAIMVDDPHLFMDVSLYSNSKECRSRDQGIEGTVDLQWPTSGSTAESTKLPDGDAGSDHAASYNQRQPQSQQSSWSGDDLEEGDGGQRSLHHHDENHHQKSREITPADAAALFNKIPFPEPRRVILLRPRILD